MTRVGSCVRRIDVRIPGSSLPLMSVSQTRGVIRRTELTDKPPRAESLDVYKICRAGDIVFNKMSIRAGALGVAAEDGLITYHYEVMRPLPNNEARFIVYFMKSPAFIAELVARERGIGSGDQTNVRTTEVPFSVLKTIDVWIPTLEEQVDIADFLDVKTAKIDALIARQEQLIATLREDRTATITHAVTKGLDPDVEMKDSGVEWLGDIPCRWRHSLVKFAFATLAGYPFKSEGFSHDAADIRLLRGANVGVDKVDWTDAVYWPRDDAQVLADYELKPGDIVMGLDRPFINAGIRVSRVSANDVPALLVQRVLRLRAAKGFEQGYLFYLLTGPGLIHHLTPMFTGVSVPHVSPNQVGSFPLPQPPPSEQRRIVSFLTQRCAQIDKLIAKAGASVDLLREYRSALITDAVTGKIDVRGAA